MDPRALIIDGNMSEDERNKVLEAWRKPGRVLWVEPGTLRWGGTLRIDSYEKLREAARRVWP